MFWRTVLAVVVSTAPILATDAGSQASQLRQPDLKQLSPKQLNGMLMKGFANSDFDGALRRLQTAAALSHGAANICSIPLHELRVQPTAPKREYGIIPAPKSPDRMAVPAAAPACKNWETGQ